LVIAVILRIVIRCHIPSGIRTLLRRFGEIRPVRPKPVFFISYEEYSLLLARLIRLEKLVDSQLAVTHMDLRAKPGKMTVEETIETFEGAARLIPPFAKEDGKMFSLTSIKNAIDILKSDGSP
jgi:hypothetical protein